MPTIRFHIVALLLILSLAAGCAPQTVATPQPATQQPASVASAAQIVPASETPEPTQTLAPGVTPSPQPSPTPDLRLPPEQWRDWPVVPVATARAKEIYRLGQSLGNDPHAFSKVGDCQSIKEALMGMFDRPGYYRLDASTEYLNEAIAYFAGSFNRDGDAVQGGFNAAAVLSPMWANPDTCQAGENPLVCEFRGHKPSFAIISLEVWWNGRTPERYEQYMRKIIEYAMSKGVVPILSTKADNVEGDHSINLATTKLAYEYDIPLWNWWRAAQDLPNGGLDLSRPDRFHLADEAWLPRSLTALQALDTVWKGVRDEQPAVLAATLTAQPTTQIQVAPLAPLSEVQITPFVAPTTGGSPIGGSGKVIFGLAQRVNETLQAVGIFQVDLYTGQKTEIAPPGSLFHGFSPDGKRILFSKESSLFTASLDGTNVLQVSATFVPVLQGGAAWLFNGGVAFLSNQNGQTTLVYDRLDGSGWQRLSGASDHPVEIYPAAHGERVYWGGGTCSPASEGNLAECSVEAVFATTLDGLTVPLEGVNHPAFSPDGISMIFRRSKTEDLSLPVLGKVDGSGEREAPLPGNHVLNYAWSPDGKRLSVLLLNRSDYSGRWGSINHYLFNPNDFGTLELPRASGLNARSFWSPDGQFLLVTSTDQTANGYRVNVRVVNTTTRAVIDLTQPLALSGADLLLVTGAAWIPAF